MIIVEGPDNSGKSTLVRQLIELDPKLRLLKRNRFKPEKGGTIGSSYLNALFPRDGDRLTHGYSIADRLIASECIYGDLFRDGCRMSPAEHLAADLILRSYRAIVVHCNVPDEALMESWDSREQLYDEPLEIAHSYRKRIRQIFPTSQNIFNYDWTQGDAPYVRQIIVDIHRRTMERAQEDLSWWSIIPYGMGALNKPRSIVVNTGFEVNSSHPLPFRPDEGNFLAESIRDAEVDRDSLYLTNARKNMDMLNVPILREELNYLVDPEVSRVVLIGREAQDIYHVVEGSLKNPPASVTAIPNPRFLGRSQKTKDEYVRQIKRGLGL